MPANSKCLHSGFPSSCLRNPISKHTARTVKSIFSLANLLQRFFMVVPKWNRLGWRPRVIRIHCGEDVKNCDWDAENCQPCYKAETSWHDQAAFWSWLLLTIQVSVNQLISARLNLSKIFETKTLWKHIKRINQWSPPASIHLGKLAAVIPEATQTSVHLASVVNTESRENLPEQKLQTPLCLEKCVCYWWWWWCCCMEAPCV